MSEPLNERDLELIEVALESAISAVGSGLSRTDRADMDELGGEYHRALRKVQDMRDEVR